MASLTKRQHNVPAFYIRLWAIKTKDQVACHDLLTGKVFMSSPDGVLARRYFYEEDRDNPDNRIENLLATMEGECSGSFHKLNDIDLRKVKISNEKKLIDQVTAILDKETSESIKRFAAFQYLRIPGAIEQKRYELEPLKLSKQKEDYLLNAGRFVDTGYSYIQDRFQSLKMIVMISIGQDFITSDWPCFDLKHDEMAPLLGEDIGKDKGVVAYMPISPRLGAIFFPTHYSPKIGSHKASEVIVQTASDRIVKNQNTLVIQQADRFVVSDDCKDFVFKVASKRKKQVET